MEILQKIEAFGDDGFYISGVDYNANWDQQKISVVIDETSSIGAIIPSTNRFEVGLTGTAHYGPTHHITVSEVGYRPPDNPNNFIQLSQSVLTDNNGNPATISGEVKYAELGNGNLAVVWSVHQYNSATTMNEAQHFGRVFDPQTGAFVTDEFRIFSDIVNGNIAKIEAFGDDGFYISGIDYNANWDQQEISVVIDETSSIGAIIPSTNRFEVGLTGSVRTGPGSELKVSEVGYRPPDNPNNFIQLSQTVPTDNNGNPVTISGGVKYAELGNGNLAVVWSVNKYNSVTFMNEVQHFGRVFDPQTGAFVTDEFRIFSDIHNGYIAKIEAFGDDGFYISGIDYNANWDQQKISLVIDLSDALAPPPPPLTILGTATDVEIAAAISVDDTTNELGVFELGDGDFSQSQWGTAYNLSETVYGSRWDDNVVGGDGDQTFITLSGTDSIDGAGGVDTLAVDKNFAEVIFEKREVVSDATVNLVTGSVGFYTNIGDLVWTSPDDPGVSLVINETKPTDNFGNPNSVNGYNSVTLADGSIAVVWQASTLKSFTVNDPATGVPYTSEAGIQDIYARIFDPITGQFVTDEINVTNAQQSQYFGNLNATSGGGFTVNLAADPMSTYNGQTAVVGADGTVNLITGSVGFYTNIGDLVWTSPDDPGVSLVINETKPTDNFSDPISVNSYQSVTLADGSIAVVWQASTLKSVTPTMVNNLLI